MGQLSNRLAGNEWHPGGTDEILMSLTNGKFPSQKKTPKPKLEIYRNLKSIVQDYVSSLKIMFSYSVVVVNMA